MTGLLVQSLVDGVLIGAVFALVALGLTLIWGVMHIINFAHGEFLMVGLYLSYFLVAVLKLDPYVAVLVTVPALFVFGALTYRLTLQPILNDPQINQILLTVGLSLLLQNLALGLFSATPRAINTGFATNPLLLGNVVIAVPRLVAFIGSISAAVSLWFFLQHTDSGRAIRAASQNATAAELMGISVRRTQLIAFGIGSACVGLAAGLMLPFYYASPTVGNFFGLIAFTVVVLGGLGNFFGALAGGLLIGLTEQLGAALLPGSLSRVLTFGLFVLVIFIRPEGLFSRRRES